MTRQPAAVFSRFELHRRVDPSGVSGVGVVALGVVFPDGHAVMRWQADPANPSDAVFDDWRSIERKHGHGGATVVQWLDDPPQP